MPDLYPDGPKCPSATRARPAVAGATALLLGGLIGLVSASSAGAASVAQAPVVTAATGSVELVVNGSFSSTANGWVSSGSPAAALRAVVSSGSGFARVTASSKSTVVLNDTVNTVSAAPKGTTYTVSARVRSTVPSLYGSVRVREVASSGETTHRETFALTSTDWQSVTFSFTTSASVSSLDVNVLAWNVPGKGVLDVDDVSMKATAPAPAPAPAPPRPRLRPRPRPRLRPRPRPRLLPPLRAVRAWRRSRPGRRWGRACRGTVGRRR